MKIKIVSKSGTFPEYESSGSAGMDLRAQTSCLIKAGERFLMATGIYIELPEGYEAQVRARSGLSINHGIGLVNGVGTIDSDYRGEIKVALINLGSESYEIHEGDRIAQIIIAKYERVSWEPVKELTPTGRNEKGFGSSGK